MIRILGNGGRKNDMDFETVQLGAEDILQKQIGFMAMSIIASNTKKLLDKVYES